MAEVSCQSIILLQNHAEKIHSGYQAARNKIAGAFLRAKGNLMSVTELSDTDDVYALLAQLTASLESSSETHASRLMNIYQTRCAYSELVASINRDCGVWFPGKLSIHSG